MAPEDGGVRHLFAPWRFDYVSQADDATGCIFCAAAKGGDETLTVHRGRHIFVLLNRYPYTSGHTMVAPLQHVATLAELPSEALTEMMELGRRVAAALETVYRPHGFNLGMNLGEAAGAGIVDHLHLHVVPRWRGDTSFMSVAGGVRVIPEDLGATLIKVRTALEGDHG